MGVGFLDFAKVGKNSKLLIANFSNILAINFANKFAIFGRIRQNLLNVALSERCKGVYFVDLGESFPSYSNAYLLAKFGFDTVENEPC